MTRRELVGKLHGEYGQRLEILPWWEAGIEALDDPNVREMILWLPRQTGKSEFVMALAKSELLTIPGSYTLFIAASEQQAGAIYHRKLRRPLERQFKAVGAERRTIKFTKRGVELPTTGAALEIVATNEFTLPGRSPTLLILDEARDIPDAVYSATAPSVIGAGGKIVLASTAGPPRGFFYDLVQNPTPETWLYHSNTNDNPHANRSVLEFLKRRLGLFAPSAERRELGNEFTDDAESWLPTLLIDAAVDDNLGEIPSSSLPAYAFLDLSRKRDLTSLVVVLRDKARRPEMADHLVVGSLQVWDPRRSPTAEIDFAGVRAALANLPRRFPGLEKVLVDEGAEAGSVLPWGKTVESLTLLVTGFVATTESNIALWGALAARLHAQSLSIPRHERLLAELRGLRQESFAFGSKWRVVDSSRKFHRDVSLALAGACFAAGERSPCMVCHEPDCSGYHFMGADAGSDVRKSADDLQAEANAMVEEKNETSRDEVADIVSRTGSWFPGDAP